MDFNDWLLRQEGLSPKTVSNYSGALYGRLSELYGAPLHEIRDQEVFQRVVQELLQNPTFKEINATGHYMYSAALKKYQSFLEFTKIDSFDAEYTDMEAIVKDTSLLPTEKLQLVHARLGQGMYREGLMKIWHGRCSVTGYSDSRLLIASHIKPWCRANNKERLDPYNGFLLTPTLDKVFDKGLITFDPRKDGKIVFSKSLKDIDILHLSDTMSVPILNDSLAGYLKYHRKYIFLP